MTGTVETSSALKDLFLADLDRLEESIWRNEKVGEKRFEFFVALVGAVLAGLVAFWTAENKPVDARWLTDRAILGAGVHPGAWQRDVNVVWSCARLPFEHPWRPAARGGPERGRIEE